VSRRAPAPTVEVFAVEPTAAQLIVRSPDDGAHTVCLAGQERVVPTHGGVGAVVFDGLAPETAHPVQLDGRPAGALRTLAAPPGRYLGRFATVSDLHVGETGLGHAPRLHLSADPARAHPVVCLRAALAELTAWGAEALVVKGDVTHRSSDREYDLAGLILAGFAGPLHVMPGNHDGGNHHHDDPVPALARHGISLTSTTTALCVGGLDVVLANTVRHGHEHGYAPPPGDPLFELVAHGRPAMVLLHHQLMTTRVPYYLPPGVPAVAARRLLADLAAANPATFVTTGHTHRHRRRRAGSVVVTEVGSVKDHPGTWAGYLIHEGGIVQTVRRIMDPAALAWTEYSRRTALGAWGRWSPGRLTDRSFTHTWPA
jgi:3',5'-cyclic-AMP phosphodiesterase